MLLILSSLVNSWQQFVVIIPTYMMHTDSTQILSYYIYQWIYAEKYAWQINSFLHKNITIMKTATQMMLSFFSKSSDKLVQNSWFLINWVTLILIRNYLKTILWQYIILFLFLIATNLLDSLMLKIHLYPCGKNTVVVLRIHILIITFFISVGICLNNNIKP